MKQFEGKVALITGGSRGIGRGISRRLAGEGCSVAINFISDHDSAESLLAELKNAGAKASIIQAHIGDPDSRRELWEKFDREFDHIDFLISNAATGVFREASNLSLNSVKKVMAVNFESLFDLVQNATKRMPRESAPVPAGSRGRVIALSSIGGERVIPNYGSVGASKAALEAAIRQFAFELGPAGINCNTVRAGLVDTGVLRFLQGKDDIVKETISHTPNRRLVTPEDVAGLVVFLLSSDSSMINGQTVTVDGGHCIRA